MLVSYWLLHRMRKFCLFVIIALCFLANHANGNDKDNLIPGPVDATILKIIDGDTIVVKARIWLGQEIETRVRFMGIDAPELKGRCEHETKLARQATNLLKEKLRSGNAVLYNIGYDKYAGRVVAKVFNKDGEDLSAILLKAGLAREYAGKKRKPWCTNPPQTKQ